MEIQIAARLFNMLEMQFACNVAHSRRRLNELDVSTCAFNGILAKFCFVFVRNGKEERLRSRVVCLVVGNVL